MASDHFVASSQGLGTVDTTDVLTVTLADQSTVSISGSAPFAGGKLSKVHYAPTFGSNLLSVSQLVQEGKSVHFTPERCWVDHGDTAHSGPDAIRIRHEGNAFRLTMTLPSSPAEGLASPSTPPASTAMKITSKRTAARIRHAHDFLGHPCAAQLYEALKNGHITGFDIPIQELTVADCTFPCEVCLLTKSRAASHHAIATAAPKPAPQVRTGHRRERVHKRSTVPYSFMYMDTKGPIETASYGGSKYAHVLVDDATREGHVFVSRLKSDMLAGLQRFEGQTVRASGRQLHKLHLTNTLRMDRGGQGKNHLMDAFLTQASVRPQYTSAHSSAANAVVERRIGLLQDTVRAIRIGGNLPAAAWAECYQTANHLVNILPTTANPGCKSPYEMKHGKPYDARRLHPIGVKCFVHVHNAGSLAPVAVTGTLVGYASDSHCYRVLLNTSTGKIVESADVRFLIAPSPSSTTPAPDNDGYVEVGRTRGSTVPSPPPPPRPTDPAPLSASNQFHGLSVDGDDHIDEGSDWPSADADAHILLPEDSTAREEGALIQAATQSRPSRNKQAPKWLDPAVYARPACARKAQRISFHAAQRDPVLKASMAAELADLLDNDKIRVVDLPAGEPEIDSTWAHKKKTDATGAFVRAKSRLCPRGFQQIPGKHFDPTKLAAPTVSLYVVFWLLALQVCRNMTARVIDVTGAFSTVPLKETIYMKFPHGMAPIPGKTILLRHSLQGTRQAAYNWYITVVEWMLSVGFERGVTEPCLYGRYVGAQKFLLVVSAYVDDFRILGDRTADVDAFSTEFHSRFLSKDVDPSYYLGIEIDHDVQQGELRATMVKYTAALLEEYRMSDCHPVSTPAAPGTKLVKTPEGASDPASEAFPYCELVGSLMWLSRTCRPDILYAVNQLAAHSRHPGPSHIVAAKRILRYLKGTISLGLTFRRQPTMHIGAYSDADFAGEPEGNDHPMRSLTGMLVQVDGVGPIYWQSSLQASISNSTAGAEYRAAADTARVMQGVRHLQSELGLLPQGPSILREDNMACIAKTQTAVNPFKSRHLSIDYHSIKELVADGIVTLQACPTKFMVADIFTKALATEPFEFLRDRLLGTVPTHRCSASGGVSELLASSGA